MPESWTSGARLRAALIVDGPSLPGWAADAVVRAQDTGMLDVIAVLVCRNNVSTRRPIKNFCYYVMRALMVRPVAWRHRPLLSVIGSECVQVVFDAELDGSWQRVPEALHRRAAAMDLDVVIKFGMGLLRDPHKFPARFGVLSYHHGDPSRYRGRPAAFYELLHDEPYVGAVVQRLTNRLDGGEFLAQGRFRIERHSYRATLDSLYSGSSYLLAKALAACVHAQRNPAAQLGKNYRLPDNLTVCRFAGRLAARTTLRLGYGAFRQKSWRLFEIERAVLGDLTGDRRLRAAPLPLPDTAEFVADPFYCDPEGKAVICERMPRGRSKGDLVRISIESGRTVPVVVEPGRHMSYPYSVLSKGRVFVLPEVSAWSAPFLMEIDPLSGALRQRIPLLGLESERIVDATLLEHDGLFWLFATPAIRYRNLDTLMLWSSERIEGSYRPHPMNPIVLDPAAARSGGRVLTSSSGLIRFGQINSGAYGSGLAVMSVDVLTVAAFRERQIGVLRWQGFKGPHTIDFCAGRVVLDGYCDVFSVKASLRRVAQSADRSRLNASR